MISLPDDPNILVIRGGAIGDFILTLPAIGALRERWPAAHIEILGYPRIIALADRRHYANAVRSIDAAAMSRFFADRGPLDDALGRYFASFDLVVSWLYDPDDIFSNNLLRVGVHHLVRGTVHPENEHAAIHLVQPLAELDIRVEQPQPRVHPSAEDRAFAENFISHHPQRVVIHPGSGGERKVWPADRWAAVIRWLREEHGHDVLLVGGEADDDARRALAPLNCHVAWNLPLPQLAAVLERCSLFLGHDSGITHLAAAVGLPTVALFGPTSPDIWRPLGQRVHVLTASGPVEQLSLATVKTAVSAMIR